MNQSERMLFPLSFAARTRPSGGHFASSERVALAYISGSSDAERLLFPATPAPCALAGPTLPLNLPPAFSRTQAAVSATYCNSTQTNGHVAQGLGRDNKLALRVLYVPKGIGTKQTV